MLQTERLGDGVGFHGYKSLPRSKARNSLPIATITHIVFDVKCFLVGFKNVSWAMLVLCWWAGRL